MAADESQKLKWGDRWSKEWGQKSTPCVVNGSLSSQEFGVGATVSKIQRSSRTPRWHCERWFRFIRSIYWAGIIGVTNDGCKSNGCHIKTTRMLRTSGRRNISSHPGQNVRCTQIIENSKVKMSIYLDTSTKTQMSQIMVQYGRPSCSSWATSVRSPSGRTIKEKKGKSRKFYWNTVGKKFQIGNAYMWAVKKDYSRLCMWTIKIWLGRNKTLVRRGKEPMKDVDLEDPTSFLDHVYLGCTQIVETYRDMFESRISAGALEKLPNTGKLDANMFSWSYDMEGHAKKCVQWYCELANKTTQQLFKVATPCIDDHHFKEEQEVKSVGELLTNCSKMLFWRALEDLIFYGPWKILLVLSLMDEGMRQAV